MIHNIHRSQIRLYLQEHGLISDLIIDQDIYLAYHGTHTFWLFNQRTYTMIFEPTEQAFVITISE
jgi:hypothetical protein